MRLSTYLHDADETFQASDRQFMLLFGEHPAMPVVTIGPLRVILVDGGHGEDLRQHLAVHGIAAQVYPGEEGPIERLEIRERVDADALQEIVNDWEILKVFQPILDVRA